MNKDFELTEEIIDKWLEKISQDDIDSCTDFNNEPIMDKLHFNFKFNDKIIKYIEDNKNLPATYYLMSELYLKGIIYDKNIKKSLECLEISAQNGFKISNFILACNYARGEYVEKNLKLAEEYANKEIELGGQRGYVLLVDLYSKDDADKFGNTIKKDMAKIIELTKKIDNLNILEECSYQLDQADDELKLALLQEGISIGDTNCMLNYGDILCQNNQTDEALIMYELAKDLGNIYAYSRIALIYLNCDLEKTKNILKEGIGKNCDICLEELANLYFLEENYEEAKIYYQKCVERNIISAYKNYSFMLMKGLSVEKDIDALNLLLKVNDDPECNHLIACLYAKYNSLKFTQDIDKINKANEYFEKAISQNHGPSFGSYGVFLFANKNDEKALEICQKGLELGFTDVCKYLGIIYQISSTHKNIDKAIEYHRLNIEINKDYEFIDDFINLIKEKNNYQEIIVNAFLKINDLNSQVELLNKKYNDLETKYNSMPDTIFKEAEEDFNKLMIEKKKKSLEIK